MAIDNNSLCYLFDSIFQVENVAGRPVVGGHIEVFIAGTDQKYITWQNFDGTKNPFKIPLNNDGRAVILVEPHYTYDIYIYDSFNNMICSRLNVKPAIGGDVTVYGLTEVWHDGTMSGEGTPQSPLSVVSAGKVYDGIEPIVVNNIENKISAQHIPLGVQDPLYFVEDSETACIIGFSGETIPEGVMSESALGFENNKITGYNGSAFSAGNEYEAGSYVDIDNNTISVTGLQPEGDYAYNSALSSKLDVTALPQDLVHSGDLTAYYPTSNPSGFITGVDLTDYATTAQLDEKLDKSDSGNFYPMTGNPSGFLTAHQSLQGYATEQWVEGKGYITGVDIPESAVWNATTNTVSSNSAQWGASNPQIPVTGINGIKISESGDKVVFEVSGDYYPGDNPSGFITGVDLSDYATTAQVSEKLDTTAFSDVSGNFLTAVPDTYLQNTDLTITDNKVTEISGIPLAGGAAGVSGTNVVFVPEYEGTEFGRYYSATISGDVVVTTGNYYDDGATILPGRNYSLSSIGGELGNKLDKNKIEDSNTIAIINNHAEVTDKAYRRIGLTDISAYSVNLESNFLNVSYNAEGAIRGSRLVSAIIIVETNESGSDIPDGWSLVSYENNSAVFTKSYPLGQMADNFNIGTYGGWGEFTNVEASATVYTALEIASLAFKDEIIGITYTTGSI